MRLRIYLLTLIFFNVSSLFFRQRYSDEEFTAICNNADIEYKSFNLTFNQYISQLSGNSSDILDVFEYILINHTEIEYVLLLRKFVKYILVFLFPGIILISWLCFGFCCLCNCGMFKKRSNKSNLVKLINFGSFGLLIVLSLFAIGLSPAFSKYFHGSICSFFQIFNHTLEGDFETSEDSTRWVGLNNIEQEIYNKVDEVNITVETLFNKTTEFEKYFSNYSEQLQNLLKIDIETNVINPTNGEELIQADYSVTFPKFMNEVDSQYSTIKDLLQQLIEFIKEKVNDLFSFKKKLVKKLKRMLDKMIYLSDEVSSMREKFSSIIMPNSRKISNNIYLSFIVMFGLFILFGIIGLVILILYSYSNKRICRYCIHLLWIGLLLFLIGGLVIGCILGIFGAVSGEVTIIIPHVLSKDFLSREDVIDTVGDFRKYIPYMKICLEKDGDLMNTLGYNLDIEELITLFNEFKIKLDDFRNKIKESFNSGKRQNFTSLIQSYHDDYSSAFSQINPSFLQKIFFNLNSKFSNGYNDIFVTKKADCPDDKIYLSPNETRGGKGNYCLVAHEWEPEKIKAIFSSLREVFEAFQNLYAFIKDNRKVTYQILIVSLAIESIFNEIMGASLIFSNFTQYTMTSIKAFYKALLGNNGDIISNKLNCNYIKDDLITFIDQLFIGVANNSLTVGIISIMCSIVAYFSMIMLIVYINSKGKKEKEEQEERNNELSEPLQMDLTYSINASGNEIN